MNLDEYHKEHKVEILAAEWKSRRQRWVDAIDPKITFNQRQWGAEPTRHKRRVNHNQPLFLGRIQEVHDTMPQKNKKQQQVTTGGSEARYAEKCYAETRILRLQPP
jgi:hypothetical protein